MNRKRTTYGIVFFVGLTGILLLRGLSSEDSAETSLGRANKTASQSVKDEVLKRSTPAENLDSIRRRLRKLQEIRHRLDDGALDFNDQMTVEELTRYAIMSKIVSPVFIDKAPEAFDAIIESEELNPRWTEIRENAFGEILKQPDLAGVALKAIGCYQDFCKVVLSVDSEERMTALNMALMNNDDLNGASHTFHQPQEDGTYLTSAYIGRRGDDLPLLNEVTARIYESMTGESPDSIVPTRAQLDKMVAYRDGTLTENE